MDGQEPFTAMASSDSGGIVAVVDKGGFIYTSYDYGVTWVSNQRAGNYSWTGVAVSADGFTMVAVASDSTVAVSTTAGLSWVLQPAPKQNWTSVTIDGDGVSVQQRIVVASSLGQIFQSINGGGLGAT